MVGNHHQVSAIGDPELGDLLSDAGEIRIAELQRVQGGLRAEAAMMLRYVGIVLPENHQRGMAAERRRLGLRQGASGHKLCEVSVACRVHDALARRPVRHRRELALERERRHEIVTDENEIARGDRRAYRWVAGHAVVEGEGRPLLADYREVTA